MNGEDNSVLLHTIVYYVHKRFFLLIEMFSAQGTLST